jgi:hypothetical protein
MTPYYERKPNSFADDIITKVSQGDNGLWYATLDTGPNRALSDPDFSTCAETPEEATRRCAAAIRADAQGIGKYAPHGCLKPGSYDLHFRLMKWWAEKESL